MAEKINSIGKILENLNPDLQDAPWVEVEGVFSLQKSSIDKASKQVVISSDSLVLKVFFNKKTAEVKTYIAKVLEDEQETSELP